MRAELDIFLDDNREHDEFVWLTYAESGTVNRHVSDHNKGTYSEFMDFLSDNGLRSEEGGSYQISLRHGDLVVIAEYEELEDMGHLPYVSAMSDPSVTVVGSNEWSTAAEVTTEVLGEDVYRHIVEESPGLISHG